MTGVAVGAFYTWGPMPLKFNALGDLCRLSEFRCPWFPGCLDGSDRLPFPGHRFSGPFPCPSSSSVSCMPITGATSKAIRPAASKPWPAFWGMRLRKATIPFCSSLPLASFYCICCYPSLKGLQPEMPLTFLITFVAIPRGDQAHSKRKASKKSCNASRFHCTGWGNSPTEPFFRHSLHGCPGPGCYFVEGIPIVIIMFRIMPRMRESRFFQNDISR